jgi:hypothetical protein
MALIRKFTRLFKREPIDEDFDPVLYAKYKALFAKIKR